MKLVWHWTILILSFGAVFLWEQSSLDTYTIQVLAGLVIIYILIAAINKKRRRDIIGGAADIFILNTSILLLISITGNLYSPLYFLLYFLGFGITFIFEPLSVFVYVLGAIAIFLPEALKNGSVESFIRLGSLILISPLAFFFGQEYRDRDVQEEKIEEMRERVTDAGETIEQEVKTILNDDPALKKEEVAKLKEVLSEAKDLKKEGNE